MTLSKHLTITPAQQAALKRVEAAAEEATREGVLVMLLAQCAPPTLAPDDTGTGATLSASWVVRALAPDGTTIQERLAGDFLGSAVSSFLLRSPAEAIAGLLLTMRPALAERTVLDVLDKLVTGWAAARARIALDNPPPPEGNLNDVEGRFFRETAEAVDVAVDALADKGTRKWPLAGVYSQTGRKFAALEELVGGKEGEQHE